jgi:hypothetical protein
MSKAVTEGDRLLSCSSLFSLFNNVVSLFHGLWSSSLLTKQFTITLLLFQPLGQSQVSQARELHASNFMSILSFLILFSPTNFISYVFSSFYLFSRHNFIYWDFSLIPLIFCFSIAFPSFLPFLFPLISAVAD